MIYLALAWPVMGALWRRAFGGWGGVSRGILEIPCVAMAAFPFSWAFTGPLPFWWSVATGAVFSSLVLLFFIRGFVSGPIDADQWSPFRKYGPFGAGYWLAWRYWPASWRLGGFIDGPYSVGELFLGASVYALIGILWLA